MTRTIVPDHAPDTARIQADLEALVAIESPTDAPERVTAAIAAAQAMLEEAGATTARIPGRDGYGDHVAATVAGGREGAPVLIHSAKGAERFARLTEAAGQLDALRAARVIAISSAAAEPLKSLGVARLTIAKRPDEAALFDALENRPSARA